MKSIFTIILFLTCLGTGTVWAQFVFHSADSLPLLGKIADNTETRYERLPIPLESVSRPPVWYLGKCSAGLALRFRSNSSRIAVRWETLRDTVLPHMAPTGVKGIDLYALEDDEWTYVRTARPTAKQTETTLISGMEVHDREWMLYLPLYDGLTSIEIGIDSAATLTPPIVPLPRRVRPLVAYGTSILQGGCASRPGMAHTNILSRRLNREVINLGFSGNGQLDYEIASLMAQCDASLYILDFMPNVSVEQILDRTETFYRILRAARPTVPILLVEHPFYPHSRYNPNLRRTILEKNNALRSVFARLKTENDPHLHLIPAAPSTDSAAEDTVDGVHLTDLGFMRYADYLYPILLNLLNDNP